MLNKTKYGFVLKLAAILLIVVAVFWFAVERKSANSQGIATGTITTITNSPNQWEQPQNSFSASDAGEGNVTLTAEYLPEKSSNKTIVLKIYLNTHSVDLSGIDFRNDIYVEKDGKKIYPLTSVDEGEGHHRASELTFDNIDFPFKVVGENIGGVERREIQIDIKG